MQVFYTPRYYADIGEGHVFPIRKFELVRDRLLSHQGNGTATIFSGDLDVFTFSMHGARNYPLFKPHSSLDIELPDGTSDEPYLEALAHSLISVFQHKPQIVFYLGGADPYIGDKLGRLAVSIEGLRKRDEYVLSACYEREVPVVTVMSGGYGENISDTVEIHCNTIRAVRSIFGERERVFGAA